MSASNTVARFPEQSSEPSLPVTECFGRVKIQTEHLDRLAVVYVRQSTTRQVEEHVESTALQYQLARRAMQLGWREDRVLVIDDDLGQSAQSAADRQGFQRLLAELSLNHVGLVLGIEMSRLARSCKDWYQLLEVCGLFRSLLADQDGVYDPADYNDRLLLGLKGTMSEAELHVLRGRMHQGKRNKAHRGELFTRLPVGYIFQQSGAVAMDPDQQVQAAVRLVLDKFVELGSGRAVVRYLRQHRILLPARHCNGPNPPPVQWKMATSGAIAGILTHPMYAGAYVYGRRPVDPRRKKTGKSRTGQFTVPMEKWQVLRRDHLPAYITWEQYVANRTRLQQNVSRWSTLGAPREGAAILGGLVYCDRCGHRMQVTYPEAHRPVYACFPKACHPAALADAPNKCPLIPAATLDGLVGRQILRAVQPAALELSMQAQQDIQAEQERLHQQWQLRLERARYEADRAQRQYNAVEPENRLVARELEKQWEESLIDQRQLQEEYNRFQLKVPAALSAQNRELVVALAQDLPQLWEASTTTPQDRQLVVRELVDRVTVHVRGKSEEVDVAIHWKGGFVSQHEILRPVRRYEQLRDHERLLHRLKELRAAGQTSPEIARLLNEEGFRTPKGVRFKTGNVRTLLSRLRLSRCRGDNRAGFEGRRTNEWWVSALAQELSAPLNTLMGWIQKGWVLARQLPSPGRYWIVWADDGELTRLRKLRAHYRTPIPKELTSPKAQSLDDVWSRQQSTKIES